MSGPARRRGADGVGTSQTAYSDSDFVEKAEIVERIQRKWGSGRTSGTLRPIWCDILTGIWGCEFAEENGQVRHIKNMVSFTEKTKYLYTINKGIPDTAGPYAVNEKKDTPDPPVT